MISSNSKPINVYGKRSKRAIHTSPEETSGVEATAERVPLIHRMKKRENGPAQKLAVSSKGSSPHRAVSLMKQRVIPGGSPARKSTIKRGTRVATILAEEATRTREHRYKGTKNNNVPSTPSRIPLSTISTNAVNSPAASNIQILVKMKKDCSPKRLFTSKAMSTVQMDIEVVDEKGKMVKHEKRITRTNVIVNRNTNNGGNKTLKHSEIQIAAVPRPRPVSQQPVPAPTEVISLISVDEHPQSVERGSEAHPIVLSSRSSTANDLESPSVKSPPVRRLRRAPAAVIFSDDESEEQSDHEEDTYIPPDSPPALSEIKWRKSSGSQRKSTTSRSKLMAPSVKQHSRLKVEVIPPAPYKLHRVASPPLSPPRDTHFQKITPSSPKIKKQSRTSTSVNVQPRIPPRYPPSYNLISSPPLKSRQFTPFRHKSRGTVATNGLFAYGRGVVSSPTTPTDSDFDLSFEFSQLDIGIEPNELEVLQQQGRNSHLGHPEYLRPLLKECNQEESGPYEFSAFIQTFPFDPILRDPRRSLGRKSTGKSLAFKKIGEASYSEVFGIGDVVLKVIPLRDESRNGDGPEMVEADGPAPTDAKDVRKEIIVTRAMGDVHEGFVKLLKTYVVRGKYPEVLLNLWDEYNERKGSESVRPDTFTVSQMYAIIVLPNGGPDLETYMFSNASKTGWKQAASLFWQVAKALAHAEELVSFEHRDLHWGQILVKDLQSSNKSVPLRSLNHTMNQMSSSRVKRLFMDDPGHGVQATIIDLGLSRMDAGDGSDEGVDVQWTSLEEEVFMGEGDYQFDVYRMMKWCTGENWEGYHPLTNVMWLHYLVTKLLRHKNLRAPTAPRNSRLSTTMTTNIAPMDPTRILQNIRPTLLNIPASQNGQFSEKDCYDTLVDIEEWLGKCIAEVVPQKQKGKGRSRKTTVGGGGGGGVPPRGQIGSVGAATCSCAGQVVGYGAKKGWIRPVSS